MVMTTVVPVLKCWVAVMGVGSRELETVDACSKVVVGIAGVCNRFCDIALTSEFAGNIIALVADEATGIILLLTVVGIKVLVDGRAVMDC